MNISITLVLSESGSNWTLYNVLIDGQATDLTVHGHRWVGGAQWRVREGDQVIRFSPTRKAAVAYLHEHLTARNSIKVRKHKTKGA